MIFSQEHSLYRSNVELYDIAFNWDIDDEVTWILDRLGPNCKTVLEPGCGSGRVLLAFAKRGVEIVGFDSSREGVAFAQKRIASIPSASALLGDMTNFDLGRFFDSAICPINTLAILTPNELVQHLHCMSHHLRSNARYLVQVAIREHNQSDEKHSNGIEWEAERDETRLRMKVFIAQTDYQNLRELHRFTITVDTGPMAGQVLEEEHWMTMWTPESWHKVIDASLYRQIAQYDGDDVRRSSVPIGSAGNLMWHELGFDGRNANDEVVHVGSNQKLSLYS